MKRIINYTKNNNKYIFQEEGTLNKIEIDVNEKKLSGKDLYENFFVNYRSEDIYDLIDNTTEEQKNDDKLCSQVFNKVKELFSNIEGGLKNPEDVKKTDE